MSVSVRRLAVGSGLALYLLLTLELLPGSSRVLAALAACIAPLAILGMVAVYGRVRRVAPVMALGGLILLVAAFTLFHLMVVVQQGIAIFREERLETATDAMRAETQLVFDALNSVQLSVDVAFDILYCAGIAIIALALYRLPRLGRLVTATGLASAGLMLILNVMTFPRPPAEAGLFDPGPLTAVWWIIVAWSTRTLSRKSS